MVYWILGVIAIVSIILSLQHTFTSKKKELLEKIRQAWCKPKDEPFNFERIGRYASLDPETQSHQLSKQTLYDIDFFGLFAFVDRTYSKVGQQVLFKKLIQPLKPEEVISQNERAALFAANNSLREAVQQELHRLGSNDAYYITSLMQDKLLERPTWFKFLYISVLSIITLLLLSPKFPILLLFLIIPFSGNMFIHYWNKNNTFQFIRSFPQLSLLIDVSSNLRTLDMAIKDKMVDDDVSSLRPFQWKMKLLGLVHDGSLKDDLSQVGAYLTELLKAFFLIEVYTLFQLTGELESKKASIVNLFCYIGDIDVAISIASLRSGELKTCRPQFIPSAKELHLKNVYHPLVRNCVKNDLSVNGKSVLITGSNMSGKSTFLRTVILNSILAQTLDTCFADEFKSPRLKQFSSILIDDNLFAGTSYYFEEVTIMATLIKEVDSADQNLFILDEVFKGTNTVERIASAKAILSYLNRNDNIVIVSTHDIELSAMLTDEFDLYHFTDSIENEKLHFDFKIKAGALKTRNAIKLLEMSNYPAAIIEEATHLSKSLTDTIKNTTA
jgi:DNA mismatch repair ATPase MutS